MNFQIDIKPIMELVPSAIDGLLDKISAEVRLSEEEAFQIRLILEEAVANGIAHGIHYDTSLKIQVSASLSGQQLVLVVKDEGKGFNHRDVPDPIKEQEQMKSHGRGIYLIRKYADDVRFNDAGNEITITKTISRKSA